MDSHVANSQWWRSMWDIFHIRVVKSVLSIDLWCEKSFSKVIFDEGLIENFSVQMWLVLPWETMEILRK